MNWTLKLTWSFTLPGLRNDLKNLTQKIETVLHDLHAQQREGAGMDENKTSFLNEYDECSPPFAKIGAVTEGSPAEKAVCYKRCD